MGTLTSAVKLFKDDGCRVVSRAANPIVNVSALAPRFKFFPEDAEITTEDNHLPLATGEPKGVAFCSTPFEVYYNDSVPDQQSPHGCQWIIQRTWTIRPVYKDCAGVPPHSPLSTSRIQLITINDVTAPYFITPFMGFTPAWDSEPYFITPFEELPDVQTNKPSLAPIFDALNSSIRHTGVDIKEAPVRVPFFRNYRLDNTVPIIEERAGNVHLHALGLMSAPGTLTSRNSLVDVSVTIHMGRNTGMGFDNKQNNVAQETCKQDGLARMTRTWTTKDACGNTRELPVLTTVEHPPAKWETTQTSRVGVYEAAPDYTPLKDPCLPGKNIVLAKERRFDASGPQDLCFSKPWKLDGCRTFYRSPISSGDDLVDVVATKPFFRTFPPDVTLTQHANPFPGKTGFPVPESLCGSPFKMTWSDARPDLSECGVWKIARTWKIEPTYQDCPLETLPSDHPLVTETVQVITVTDPSAPKFVQTPDKTVYVPFLTDYGPTVTGVPKVADIAGNPHLADLHLTSYPIQLEYVDTIEFSEMPEKICSNGLATVTRVWTTTDACGLNTAWTQKIIIIQNKGMAWGEASAYQVSHQCTVFHGMIMGLRESRLQRYLQFKHGQLV